MCYIFNYCFKNLKLCFVEVVAAYGYLLCTFFISKNGDFDDISDVPHGARSCCPVLCADFFDSRLVSFSCLFQIDQICVQ